MSLRVGLVGAGRWAVLHHLPGLAEHPHAELTAVVDADAARAAAVAARFGGEAVRTVDELVERVDAVIVASPPAAHHAATVAALDGDRAVLVEKPMTITADDAWEIVGAAEQRGVVVMVGYPLELTTTSARVADAVGELGGLLLVDGVYASPMRHLFAGTWPFDASDPLAVPRPETFADPTVSGGGQARGQLTHLLASAVRATGGEARAVSALFRPDGAAVDLHDAITVDFGELIGAFASSCALPQGHPPAWELRFVGERGTVLHDLATGAATVRLEDHPAVQLPPLSEAERYPSRAVVQRFVDVVLGRAENPAPAQLGAEVVAVLDAAHSSAANGGAPVPVARPSARAGAER